MKKYWERLSIRIDAMTLRERVIVFVMVALILVTLINTLVLDPLYAMQQQLSQRIKADQLQVTALQTEIQQKALSQVADPDRDTRSRLEQAKQKLSQLNGNLQTMQKGLVSPDKMSSLLQDVLRQNTKLRLISARTLPVAAIGASAADAKNDSNDAAAGKDAADGKPRKHVEQSSLPATGAIYRHGVEIVVQGGYLDLLDYVTHLEAMPWQLYWGGARLDAAEISSVTLTLTLYTLSLDKQWLNI